MNMFCAVVIAKMIKAIEGSRGIRNQIDAEAQVARHAHGR